jgi:hypothetical protein
MSKLTNGIANILNKPKMCPFCLAISKFSSDKCPSCGEQVPPSYLRDYWEFPPVVVNAVGFRGHGKTVYFSSLFYTLNRELLAPYWDDFYYFPVSEEGMSEIKQKAEELAAGKLPDSTPKAFLKPVLLHLAHMPMQPNCTLLIYDTGGETFQNVEQIKKNASFLRRAQTVMFLISVSDMQNPNIDMTELLQHYIMGMQDGLGVNTERQHLVVVYTKSDHIEYPHEWAHLEAYLEHGTVAELKDTQDYMYKMFEISKQLRIFTRDVLKAHHFIALADKKFKSVTFSMVSALGAEPEDGRLSISVTPRRIMDPLLWMMDKSL